VITLSQDSDPHAPQWSPTITGRADGRPFSPRTGLSAAEPVGGEVVTRLQSGMGRGTRGGPHRSAPREEYFERVPHMRDHSNEERQAFFERHETFWV
jgi:hypothetical protein